MNFECGRQKPVSRARERNGALAFPLELALMLELQITGKAQQTLPESTAMR
jgi:hypothetical protein